MNKITTLFVFFLSMQVIFNSLDAQSAPRFVDNGNNTITDTVSGLMWRKRTPNPMSVPAVTWSEALEKCKEMNLGGYNDWRLPTVEEWSTIIDTENQFPALVVSNPFENVIVNSPYWALTEYTYGTDYSCDAFGCPLKAHVALLYLGYIGHQSKKKKAFIWPVRSTIGLSPPAQKVTKKKLPKVKIFKEGDETLKYFEKGFIFVQEGLLSEEFELQGIQEQVKVESYIRIAINKNSKAILKPKKAGTEIAILIYDIDQKRVNLFNSNAMALDLSVRIRIEPETGAAIFYRQPQ